MRNHHIFIINSNQLVGLDTLISALPSFRYVHKTINNHLNSIVTRVIHVISQEAEMLVCSMSLEF